MAYARLEVLCQAIKAELGNDLKIHDAAVLPAFITLPQVTAAEYGRVRACLQRSILSTSHTCTLLC